VRSNRALPPIGWYLFPIPLRIRGCVSIRHYQQAAPTICQQPPTLCTALSSLDVRLSGLLCCRPYGLEHTSRRPSKPGIAITNFQSLAENSAVLILLAHQHIRGLTATMRYINLRLTLTLTLCWPKDTVVSDFLKVALIAPMWVSAIRSQQSATVFVHVSHYDATK